MFSKTSNLCFLYLRLFPGKGALVMIFLYVFGILTGIIFALILKGSLFKGEPVPFVMELPNYRMPGAKTSVNYYGKKLKISYKELLQLSLLQPLLFGSLQTFDLRFNIVTESKDSILAILAGYIAPIFNPLGFGDWRISTAYFRIYGKGKCCFDIIYSLWFNPIIVDVTYNTSCFIFTYFLFTLYTLYCCYCCNQKRT